MEGIAASFVLRRSVHMKVRTPLSWPISENLQTVLVDEDLGHSQLLRSEDLKIVLVGEGLKISRSV